jgi:hypothetical protein
MRRADKLSIDIDMGIDASSEYSNWPNSDFYK